MPALARVVVPSLPHHVTQRGNRRQTTFFSPSDYRSYLTLLRDACERAGTEVWAWCLMPNHLHLILVPRNEDGLRAALANPNRIYARMINEREGWRGHLWQERFASFPLDEAHLLAAARYIELNPVRSGLVNTPEEWAWSSARAHLEGRSSGFTRTEPLLALYADWRELLKSGMTEEELLLLRKHESTGRPLGSDSFLEQLESRTGRKLTPGRRGPKPKR